MPMFTRTVLLTASLMLASAPGAMGAGERALLPMPTADEAASSADRLALIKSQLDPQGIADAALPLIGRVRYFQQGLPTEMYVVSPEGRGAVGDVAELELTFGQGIPVTFVAHRDAVFGTKNLQGIDDATALLRAAGVTGEVRALETLKGVFVVRTASALEAFDVSERLLGLPFVTFAHPDGVSAKATADGKATYPAPANRGMPGADATPDANVLNPDDLVTTIPVGGTYNFGSTVVTVPLTKTFAIENTGDMPLTLNAVAVPGGFTVLVQPATTIDPGAASPCVVRLDALTNGSFTGSFTFASNDPDENPYTFTITGSVGGTGGPSISDPLFGKQWHLENTGQGATGQPSTPAFEGYDTNVLHAWDRTQGETARVAVLDDGIQPDHPDYAGNVLNINTTDNAFDAALSFNRGPGSHGTSVSGCVAAIANSIGVRGTAPKASLMVASSFYEQVTPTIIDATEVLVAERIGRAVAANAAVHTNSWGYVPASFVPDVIRTAIQAGYESGRAGRGTLFLFAAANGSRAIQYDNGLAMAPEVVAVGSLSNQGRRSTYSAFGPKLEYCSPSSGGNTVPGQPAPLRIATTDSTGVNGYNAALTDDGGDYTQNVSPSGFGGTSAATPISAGVAALAFSVNTDLYAAQVRRIIQHTARKDIVLGDSFTFDALSGRSQSFGAGLIDAEAVVRAAEDSLTNGGRTWPAPPTGLMLARTATTSTLTWTNPPTTPLGEYGGSVLVLRYSASETFAPADGAEYQVGATPDVGVRVIAVGDIATATDTQVGTAGNATYGVFTRNAAGRWSLPAVIRALAEEPIPVFTDSFESAGPWAVSGEGSEWERGTPNWVYGPFVVINAAHSGANAFVTDLDGFYAGGGVQHVLTSPVIDLTSANPIFTRPITSASVSWWEILDSPGQATDTVKAEVILAPTGSDGVGPEPGPTVLKTLVSKNGGMSFDWRQRWFDLRGQRGRKVQIRFTISSVLANPGSGWYLDDMRVGASVNEGGPIVPGRPRRIVLPPSFLPLLQGPFALPPAEDALPDVDLSGRVDFRDLSAVLSAYGSVFRGPGYVDVADIDADGRIGMADLVVILACMAEQPAPQPAQAAGATAE